ncbi:hypothetical protein G9A89_009338 [Geosiphon pyriformis]|nr:hypothetical protein G9A89_009338 [Geosiphon pyriformis]
MKKQWSGKFDHKWDGSFYIHEILGNGAYKLRLDDKILRKAAHGNRLKFYYSKPVITTKTPRIGTQLPLILPEQIPRDLEPIVLIEQYSKR